jgi:hypothetical protein
MKYIVTSVIPPRLHLGLDNKTYIVPQWIEVSSNTKLDDINWIKFIPKPKPIIVDNGYNTRYDAVTKKYICECRGFWRAKGLCKHVKELMSK